MFRIFGYSLVNMIRHMGLSVSVCAILSLLIIFINILFLIQITLHSLVFSIVEKIPLTLFLRSEYSSENLEVINLTNQIQKLHSDLDIQYVSPTEALDRQRERFPDLVSLLESTDENPLPASIVLYVPTLELYDLVYEIVIQYDHMYLDSTDQKLASYSTQFTRIKDITLFLENIQHIVWWIIVLFCFSVGVIVYATIGNTVFIQREHLQIAHLVGGMKDILYGPFIVQGILYVILSLIIGLSILYQAGGLLSDVQIVSSNLSFLLLEKHSFFFSWENIFLFGEIFIFLILGGLSGYIASFRYLRYT